MKKFTPSAVFVAMMLSSSLAVAQDDHRPGPPQDQQQGGPGQQGHHQGQPGHGGPQGQQQGPGGQGGGFHDRGMSEGWYRKGGHVPNDFRGNDYVVNDYRAHHLKRPHHGYHWVRSDNGDYLLVAVATGVIASIVANSGY